MMDKQTHPQVHGPSNGHLPAGAAGDLPGIPSASTEPAERDGGRYDLGSVRLHWVQGLYAHAFRRGRESRAVQPDAEVERALIEHAEAVADGAAVTHDPAKRLHQRLRDEENELRREERVQAKAALAQSRQEVREREDALAQLDVVPERPRKPTDAMLATVIAFAASLAPSFKDLFFGSLPDVFAGWAFALMLGLVFGLLVAGIFSSVDSGRASASSWASLFAGVLLSVALGALRVRDAAAVGEYVFALSLTLIELAVCIWAEAVAAAKRREFAEYHERSAKRQQGQALLDAANREHARRRAEVEALDSGIGAHISRLEMEDIGGVPVEALRKLCVAAVRDGYLAAIKANSGEIMATRGTRVEEV